MQLPKYASPKFDGIRAVIINGQAFSRNMILIPNRHVQDYFKDGLCDGLDGELLCGAHDKDVFKRTSSIVRSVDGGSAWHFKAFDIVPGLAADVLPLMNFTSRLQMLRERMCLLQDEGKAKVSMVVQTLILSAAELDAFEMQALADGYEGVMLRNPNALYKHGRATPTSQDLLKVKRFEDSEAVVLGWSPLIEVRSGRIRHDMLMGSLQVRDIYSGVTFSIGSGFDASERSKYAIVPPTGQVLTYQFFAQGAYEKPRFPTFKGFRTDIAVSTAPFLRSQPVNSL